MNADDIANMSSTMKIYVKTWNDYIIDLAIEIPFYAILHRAFNVRENACSQEASVPKIPRTLFLVM